MLSTFFRCACVRRPPPEALVFGQRLADFASFARRSHSPLCANSFLKSHSRDRREMFRERRPRALRIAPSSSPSSSSHSPVQSERVGERCERAREGRANGKSVARTSIERALGGECDYKRIAREAMREETTESVAASGEETNDLDGWRAFASDDARAFARAMRMEVERRIRVIDLEIEREMVSRRGEIDEYESGGKERRAGVKSRYVEAVKERGEIARAAARKTTVAFGTTIRSSS